MRLAWESADRISSAEAFERFYQETSDRVFRYAWVLCRDAAMAEDITADAYLRAWCNREKFRGDGSPISWLLSITYNTAMSYGRALRRGEIVDSDVLGNIADTAEQPEGSLIDLADAERVRRAITRLTPEQQQVVHLRFFEGLPHEQVAEAMGRAPNAVRALQFRALRRLRTILEADDAR